MLHIAPAPRLPFQRTSGRRPRTRKPRAKPWDAIAAIVTKGPTGRDASRVHAWSRPFGPLEIGLSAAYPGRCPGLSSHAPLVLGTRAGSWHDRAGARVDTYL